MSTEKIYHLFYEGQEVVCIAENFPCYKTTKEDKSEIGSTPRIHPRKNECLVIDEILGPFLRFDKYDSETFNWWHHSNFVSKAEFRLKEVIREQAAEELERDGYI